MEPLDGKTFVKVVGVSTIVSVQTRLRRTPRTDGLFYAKDVDFFCDVNLCLLVQGGSRRVRHS